LILDNQGTINANTTTENNPNGMNINPGEPITNTGLMEATNGATLTLVTDDTITNTGGTIQAVGAGSNVVLGNVELTGGTLASSAGGTLSACWYGGGCPGLDGPVTIAIGTTFNVDPGPLYIEGTITDNGTISLGTATQGGDLLLGTTSSAANTTLAGTGTVSMGASGTSLISLGPNSSPGTILTVQAPFTISGSGDIGGYLEENFVLVNQSTISANQVNPLNLDGNSVTNTGTLQAASGGTLELNVDVANTGGTVLSTGSESNVELGSTVTGGTLTSSSGGVFTNYNSELVGPITISAGTTIPTSTIPSEAVLYMAGVFTNDGTIAVGTSTAGGDVELGAGGTSANVTLKGRGTLTLSNNVNNRIFSNDISSPATLTNESTIQGAGIIGNEQMGFVNSGTVIANQPDGLFIGPSSLGFSNTGILSVSSGDLLQIYGTYGTFSNYDLSSETLTGGTYEVTGTLQLAIGTQNNQQNNDIVTNDANITLTGTSAEITNQASGNALAAFTTNGTKGSFTLAGNQSFTTSGSFTNEGSVKVSTGSTFTVGGSGSYSQAKGQTTVDGVLATSNTGSFRGGSFFDAGSGSIKISKGSVFGNGGNLAANVSSSGTLTPADSATSVGALTVTGGYTQTSTGALDTNIEGASAGQFDVLTVTGSASLNGTLNIGLLNGYVPAVGATFKILTANHVSGTFATVNGTAINGSEHFTVTYNSNNVTLTVASGAV
jgi:hypothetical protein